MKIFKYKININHISTKDIYNKGLNNKRINIINVSIKEIKLEIILIIALKLPSTY